MQQNQTFFNFDKVYLMKNSVIILFVSFTFSISNYLLAQEKAPVISGKVVISIEEGTFNCDLTLSNIPDISNYFIRLNAGMNILHFRSKKPNDFLIAYETSLKDTRSTGESKAYYFADDTKQNKFLPNVLQIKYVGKFPVIKDTIEDYSREDWKGNIAFNHNSVRADGTQSA